MKLVNFKPGILPQTGCTDSIVSGDDGDLQKGLSVTDRFIFKDNIGFDTITGLEWIQDYRSLTGNNLHQDSSGLYQGLWTLGHSYIAGDFVSDNVLTEWNTYNVWGMPVYVCTENHVAADSLADELTSGKFGLTWLWDGLGFYFDAWAAGSWIDACSLIFRESDAKIYRALEFWEVDEYATWEPSKVEEVSPTVVPKVMGTWRIDTFIDMGWEDSLEFCANFNYRGTGWRMATMREVAAIVDWSDDGTPMQMYGVNIENEWQVHPGYCSNVSNFYSGGAYYANYYDPFNGVHFGILYTPGYGAGNFFLVRGGNE